jgi:hypothetical protein
MWRWTIVLLCCVLSAGITTTSVEARRVELKALNPSGRLPADMLEPELHSTWDLSGVTLPGDGIAIVGAHPGRESADPRPRRWVNVTRGEVRLPGGTREATLQRGIATREDGADLLMHRWIDARLGVVAQIAGTATVDGTGRIDIVSASVLDGGVEDAATMKLYVDEVEQPILGTINLGYDRGEGVTVAELLGNDNVVLMGDVVDLDYWDFSVNTSGTTEVYQTNVTLSAQETCNEGRCGFVAGRKLGRQDRSDGRYNNQVTETENRGSDVTIWMRAFALRENSGLCFGNGESGACYEGTDDNGNPREEVPLWRFPHQDGGGYYLQALDSWSSGVFDCEENIWNTVCLESKGCVFEGDLFRTQACDDNAGTQSGEVLKGGVVKLPSGHRFNTLLVRQVADFCTYALGSGCAFLATQVRTLVYLWQATYVGTVALAQTDPTVEGPADLVSFSELQETNINYGLFPPESIAVRTVGPNSVEIWWDPGNDTHHVKDYKVYWDTDSGADTPYANSVVVPSPPATVSGLDPATTYYFTVTTRSDFSNPSTGMTIPIESLLYPKQVSGDPGFVYPIEVQATTTGGSCTPEVTEVSPCTGGSDCLTVDKTHDGGVQICWTPSGSSCLDAYDVLYSVSPGTAFDAVSQTGLATCWTGDPDFGYFLVRGRGAAGVGP